MNTISNLLTNKFATYSLQEQLHIKQLGRPMPDLDIKKTQNISSGSSYQRTRKFNPNIYSKSNWLCGCDERQMFYCFPCVLFGGDTTWGETGVRDLVHIWEKIRVHEKSKIHMKNTLNFAMLGKSEMLRPTYRQALVAHNKQVDTNRSIVDVIINCIRFCRLLELALKDPEKEDEVIMDLIDFSSHLERRIKEHICKLPAFRNVKTIQDELLECMLEVYHEEIAKEIKTSEYVAVIVETADANELRLVIILRYVLAGKPVERFWDFVCPTSTDATSISKCILNEIDPLISDTKNLISQSYDGVSVLNGHLDKVEDLIKVKYYLANYIHYYGHDIDAIMKSAASSNRSVQIFFTHLSAICSFFSTSPHMIILLDETVQRRVQHPLDVKWNFESEGVNTVYEYRKDLISVMETLQNNKSIRLASTIEKAGAYMVRLSDPDFVFWLAVFHKVMPYVAMVLSKLQEKNMNCYKVDLYFREFEDAIQNIRLQMDEIIAYVDFELSEDELRYEKTPRTLTSEYKKNEALDMCDSIVHQVRTRFSYTEHFAITNLLNAEYFAAFSKKLPENYINQVSTAFPVLDRFKLRMELQVLYDREDLRNTSGAVALLSLLLSDEISDIFQETARLLRLLLTMPLPTPEKERCFPILKNVKNFLKNTKQTQGLSALGMLSFEKAYLNNIDNFNKRVLELFANKKGHETHFQYRTI